MFYFSCFCNNFNFSHCGRIRQSERRGRRSLRASAGLWRRGHTSPVVASYLQQMNEWISEWMNKSVTPPGFGFQVFIMGGSNLKSWRVPVGFIWKGRWGLMRAHSGDPETKMCGSWRDHHHLLLLLHWEHLESTAEISHSISGQSEYSMQLRLIG